MSNQPNERTMVQRVLAIAEILSTVATPEEIRKANMGEADNIISLSDWQDTSGDIQAGILKGQEG